jgi:hypothetical protein
MPSPVPQVVQLLPVGADLVELDAHAVADHPLVARSLKEGWTVHIPLSILTNDNCRAALFVDHLGSKPHSDRGPLFFDASAEPSISLADFSEAWPRL